MNMRSNAQTHGARMLSSDPKLTISFFKTLIRSFYSLEPYQAAYLAVRGWGLSYLWILLWVLCLGWSMKMIYHLDRTIIHRVIEPLEKAPVLIFHHGELEHHVFLPEVLNNAQHRPVLMIDTRIDRPDLDRSYYPDLTWLFTRDALYFYPPTLPFVDHLLRFEFQAPIEVPFDTALDGPILFKEWIETSHVIGWVHGFVSLIYPCLVFFFGVFLSGFSVLWSYVAVYYVRAVFRLSLAPSVLSRLTTVALTPALTMLIMVMTFYEAGLSRACQGFMIIVAIYFNIVMLRLKRWLLSEHHQRDCIKIGNHDVSV